jgi:hypothetical protein
MSCAAQAGASRYWELTVAIPADASEGLTNFVWELGALGVVEEETGEGPARLRAFFSGTVDTGVLTARVDAYVAALDALGFAGGRPARVAPIADADWAEAWRAHFAPFTIGRRLVVAPPWETAPTQDGRLVSRSSLAAPSGRDSTPAPRAACCCSRASSSARRRRERSTSAPAPASWPSRPRGSACPRSTRWIAIPTRSPRRPRTSRATA